MTDLLECFLQNYSCNTFQSVVNTDLLADISKLHLYCYRYSMTEQVVDITGRSARLYFTLHVCWKTGSILQVKRLGLECEGL